MPCRTGTNVSVATGQQFFANFDGTGSLWKFQPDGSNCFNGSMGDDVMLRKYRIDNEQQQVPPPASVQNQLVQIDTTGLMEIPLERYALFGSGRLEICRQRRGDRAGQLQRGRDRHAAR